MLSAFKFEETKPVISNDELLGDLRAVAADLGAEVLSQRQYREFGRYSTRYARYGHRLCQRPPAPQIAPSAIRWPRVRTISKLPSSAGVAKIVSSKEFVASTWKVLPARTT